VYLQNTLTQWHAVCLCICKTHSRNDTLCACVSAKHTQAMTRCVLVYLQNTLTQWHAVCLCICKTHSRNDTLCACVSAKHTHAMTRCVLVYLQSVNKMRYQHLRLACASGKNLWRGRGQLGPHLLHHRRFLRAHHPARAASGAQQHPSDQRQPSAVLPSAGASVPVPVCVAAAGTALLPGHSNTPMTNDNRLLYCHLLVRLCLCLCV